MEKQFADYETSKKLKELEFDESCFGVYSINGKFSYAHKVLQTYRPKNSQVGIFPTAPLWQQVEEWLFDKHKIRIDILSHGDVPDHDFICSVLLNESVLVQSVFEHPIKARMDGIRQSVEYLHKQLNK